MRVDLSLVGLLSICSFSFGQECKKELLKDVDFRGSDVAILFSPDAEHCQMLCTQHHACLFFSFIWPDHGTSHFKCSLMSTAYGLPLSKRHTVGITSGFSLKFCCREPRPCLSRVYQNVDFLGADYLALFTADYEECQRACTQDPYCQFFTFVNGSFPSKIYRYKCHLKFSWTIPITPLVERRPGAVSGFSHNAQMTEVFSTTCQCSLLPGIDIPGHDIKTLPASSPEQCQALCSAFPRCTYFSYVSHLLKCFLKHNPIKMEGVPRSRITSGLPQRFCQLSNDWLKVLHPGVNFGGCDIRVLPMNDAETCQRICTQDSTCQFYTYTDQRLPGSHLRGQCSLKSVITIPAPPVVNKLSNAVSGFSLRSCNV